MEKIKNEVDNFDKEEFIKQQISRLQAIGGGESAGAEILRALLEEQEKNRAERQNNLRKFEQQQRMHELEKKKIEFEMEKLKKETNKVEYKMVPSDVINEEDLEESAGDLSVLKRHLNRNSVNGSIKSQTFSRQSPFAKTKSKAADLPEANSEHSEEGQKILNEEPGLPEKEESSIVSEKFIELKDMVKSIEIPKGKLIKPNIEPAPSQSYSSVERPKKSRGSMKSESRESRKSESRCSKASATRESVKREKQVPASR